MKEILGRRGLLHVAAITTLLILVGGGCLSILEPETVKGGFGDGIWRAIVAATTVGYGDISPSTLWGRIIAALLMLVGIVPLMLQLGSAEEHLGSERARLFVLGHATGPTKLTQQVEQQQHAPEDGVGGMEVLEAESIRSQIVF